MTTSYSFGGDEQVGKRRGVVREVAVDLDEMVEAVLESPGEAGAIGATESTLGAAFEDVDAAQLRADSARALGGPVGTAVIDHQHVTLGHDLIEACATSSSTLKISLYVGKTTSVRIREF